MTITPEKLRELAKEPYLRDVVVDVRRYLRTAADEIERQNDKLEGLDSDLRMAVQTAYDRGATEWARLNYPQWIEWLEASARAHRLQIALDDRG